MQSQPIAPPHDAYNEDELPLARPVTVTVSGADHGVQYPLGLLHHALRLAVYHTTNVVIGLVGFALVVVGTPLSIALAPLCCLGVVVFRLEIFAVRWLAQMDVACSQFISRSPKRIRGNEPIQHSSSSGTGTWLDVTSLRPPPELALSRRALLAALYFATVKFALALASALAVAMTFAFPVTTFSVSGMRATFFSTIIGLVGFVLLTLLLLLVGTAFMNFTADISCAATHYFCGQDPIQYSADMAPLHDNINYPVAVPTSYGAMEKA